MSTVELKICDHVLEYVSTYRYLGVTFNEHMESDACGDILADSASRALGSIVARYKHLNDMGYHTYEKLYNSCVIPVMDYCSEVWSNGRNSKSQGVQNKALRIFLGVHRFAPLAGLQGDMGWMSVDVRHKLLKLRYWNKLVSMADNRLTKHVFMYDYNRSTQPRVVNWCSSVKAILTDVEMTDVFDSLLCCDIDTARTRLCNIHHVKWLRDVSSKPKLRLYAQIKTVYEAEPYVKMNLTRVERSYLARLRLGILPIMVETGRFRNLPLELRICPFCDAVEDEIHFLFNCLKYQHLRTIHLSHHVDNNLSHVETLKILYNNRSRALGKYISNSFMTRQNSLYT